MHQKHTFKQYQSSLLCQKTWRARQSMSWPAEQARSTQCQPWARAGSCAAPGRGQCPCPAVSPAPWPWHTVPQPRHPCPPAHTPLPQDSQTGCWPWSVTTASLSVKSQSRSAPVFLEEAPIPPQLFSQSSPQAQCQNTHSSSWAMFSTQAAIDREMLGWGREEGEGRFAWFSDIYYHE